MARSDRFNPTSGDEKPDDGEPTTSTSDQDASTTQGAAAAGVTPPESTPSSEGGAATAQQDKTVHVQIEQAPPEPDVLYPGDPNATKGDRPHVRADYKPFEW